MSRSFGPRLPIGLVVLAALWLITAPGAWAQKPADGVSGFAVELVYQVPDVEHPSVITCDEAGNLFVGEDPIDMRGPTTKEFDRVLLIRFDPKTGAPTKTVFCDHLSAVFGLLYADGALYVMHAPHYSVFRDTDGDGVADSRQYLAEGFGEPCGKFGLNDHIVSGLCRGLDGRVYVSVGDKGIPRAIGSDGSSITLEGGGIVSMRLDGSRLEVVTSGTRNHLDVALDSLDNMFTFDNTDDGGGWWTRFTHQVPTGYYGYPYDFLKHPERHLPRISEHGSGSPCGAACYREAAWPEKYRDNVFCCEYGKGKVQRFIPKRSGATFTAELADFLVHDGQEEFRPIDLCFTPDGRTMYLADWNFAGSREPKAHGRLFRVRYVGDDAAPEPARLDESAPLEEQLKALSHPAYTERMRAQQWLSRAGRPAGEPLFALVRSPETPKLAKVHAIWAEAGMMDYVPGYDASGAWIAALDDPDADVRSQAARALGEERVAGAKRRLLRALDDPDAAVRMWAAIALGRIGDPDTVPRLSAALKDNDQSVRFALVQALRTINRWDMADIYLAADNENIRRGMLLALTGVYDEQAVAALVWAATESPDPASRVLAIGALADVHRRADPYTGGWWGIQPVLGKPARPKKHALSATPRIMSTLSAALADKDNTVRAAAIEALVETHDAASAPKLAQVAADPATPLALRLAAVRGLAKLGGEGIAEPLARILADDSADSDLVLAALECVAAQRLEAALPAVDTLLASGEPEIRGQALRTIGQLRGTAAADQITRALDDSTAEVRQAALGMAGQLALRESVERILALAADPQVRDEAILALAAMPDRRALAIYLDGLVHKNPSVRAAVRGALGELRDLVGPDIVDRYRRGELPATIRAELQPVLDGPRPITTWHVAGPWQRSNRPEFDPAVAPDLAKPVFTPGVSRPWRTLTTDRPFGQVVLGGELAPSDEACALAYATLECAEDYTTLVQLGFDDEAILWVNGKQVAAILGTHFWSPAQFQVPVALKKGINHVWLLTSNFQDAWRFSVAFGTRLPEYRFLYEDIPAALDAGAYRDFALQHAGDAQKGRAIFADAKGVGCIKCHAVGGQGAKIGPDLAGIGTRYARAELIRSVLEPSNRVAETYQVTTIVTTAGRIYSGIIKTDGQDVVELVDVEGRQVSIPTGEIDERQASNVSLMPSGLKDGLTPESFADVIAYLQSLK